MYELTDGIQNYMKEIKDLKALIQDRNKEINRLREALAEAANEINCAGPVEHRIEVWKEKYECNTALLHARTKLMNEAHVEISTLKEKLALAPHQSPCPHAWTNTQTPCICWKSKV